MSDYLFAYGTLQPGLAPGEAAPLVAKLVPVGAGFIYGRLYDLGRYPGAVLDPASGRKVFGTVLELPGEASFLRELDDYEAFDPDAPGESLFLRISQLVELESGGALSCWIYVYTGTLNHARVLESGRFMKKRARS
jgi:gamma-glutamylcyclotransferase (GGCT)/AIG2-like uncharacterized protein YtfP